MGSKCKVRVEIGPARHWHVRPAIGESDRERVWVGVGVGGGRHDTTII